MQAAAKPYAVPAGTEVTLAFVDDAAMRDLNRTYRHTDKTTDVLSFGDTLPPGVTGRAAAAQLRAGPDGVIALGDIIISGAQAARQARRRRWPLGFDDQTQAGYREMLGLGKAALAAATPRRRRTKARASRTRKTPKTLER